MDWSRQRVLERALLTSVTASSVHDYFPSRTSADEAKQFPCNFSVGAATLSDFAVSFLFLLFSAFRKLQENFKKVPVMKNCLAC